MLTDKHGLLVSVVAATALMLCRGMDTSTASSTSFTNSPTSTSTSASAVETSGTTSTGDTEAAASNTATAAPTTATVDYVGDGTQSTGEVATTSSYAAPAVASSGNSKNTGDAGEHISLLIDQHGSGLPQDSKKCSYKFVNNNKYDPRTTRYDNVTEAMETAFKSSPLAVHVFNKFLDPKSPTAAVVHKPHTPIIHPDLLNKDTDSGHPKHLSNSEQSPNSLPLQPHKTVSKTPKFEDTDKDFDVNEMFNKISNNANGFSHPVSKFNGVIRRDRRIGFGSTFLKDAGHSHFLDGFGSMFRRKKRMAVPPAPKVYNGQKPKSVCPPERKIITAFVKGSQLCYLYEPEVQGIEMDMCKSQDCSVCSEHSSAQCVPQNLSAWVWAYCPGQGEVITPEYLEYPAYCSCMVIRC